MTNAVEPFTAIEFAEWEGATFGFGYGSGEGPVFAILQEFRRLLEDGRSYDYRKLEEAFDPPAAWLLINALCKSDTVEYGTSPRFGWLTHDVGAPLFAFLAQFNDAQSLYDAHLAASREIDDMEQCGDRATDGAWCCRPLAHRGPCHRVSL